MKKLTAGLIFALVGLVAPVGLHAQTANDAARIAAQKHNAKLSRKQVKAQQRAMRKARKSMGKPVAHHNTSHDTLPQ